MTTTNIERMTGELHRAFTLINKKYFDDQLPLPAITIQSSGKRLSMGWCTTQEVWRDKEGKVKMYEINLSAEYISISFEETMDTLMHEMVHLYNLVKGIQDVSRNGTYHNKRFLERALKSGFEHSGDKPDPKYGYSFVHLTDVTKTILKELPIDKTVFSIGRTRPSDLIKESESDEKEQVASKKKAFRWCCPSCNMILRSTKPDLSIICGKCKEELVETD